jgi:hypothetical protein
VVLDSATAIDGSEIAGIFLIPCYCQKPLSTSRNQFKPWRHCNYY